MKIGIIHTFYTLKGGEDVVVTNEFELLKQHNIDVVLLSFRNPVSNFLQLLYFIVSIFNIFSFYNVLKWIKKEKPDVIHIHNWHFSSSPSIFWAAKVCGIPVVHTLHNYRMLCPSGTLFHNGKVFLDSLYSNSFYLSIKNKVYRNSYFQTLWLSIILIFHNLIGTWNIPSCYIVLTNEMKNLFVSATSNLTDPNFIVKPNFASDPQFPSIVREDFFLFVGRLSDEKGIDTLISAFTGSQFVLKIIGDGPLQFKILDAVASNPNIIFLGFKNHLQIQHELNSCSALIFPSIWLEPFGLTLIEAFACCTPVISSCIGAAKEIVTDGVNGLHFQPNSPDDLLDKLCYWSQLNLSEKHQFSLNARKSYEMNFSPNINIISLTNIYRSLLIQIF